MANKLLIYPGWYALRWYHVNEQEIEIVSFSYASVLHGKNQYPISRLNVNALLDFIREIETPKDKSDLSEKHAEFLFKRDRSLFSYGGYGDFGIPLESLFRKDDFVYASEVPSEIAYPVGRMYPAFHYKVDAGSIFTITDSQKKHDI